jgi:4-amino-4-deoxy-L-arabinose transferase-like glycosyltransferase
MLQSYPAQSAPFADRTPRASRPVDRYFLFCALIVVVLTAVRLFALRFSVVDLYFDEAQYWAWAQRLEWGYFSKPPMIAWLIALAETVCGSGEACVRTPSALLYAGTALAVFALTRELYDSRTAFWAASALAASTGAAFSARIISTDVPLLLFWSLALLSLVKLLRGGGFGWSMLLGLAIGLGVLSKYAMAYFFMCLAAAAVFEGDVRRLVMSRTFLIALLVAAICLAPNLYWNATNGMATFKHTVDNAAGSGTQFRLRKLLAFIAIQFAIAGPVLFGAFLIAVARRRRNESMHPSDRLMLYFSLPILAIVSVVAFATGAHPNWAAPALVAVVVVATAWLLRRRAYGWLAASFIFAGLMQIALLAGDSIAGQITVPGLRKPDLYERTLGWKDLAFAAASRARDNGARTIAAERREDVASLAYNLRGEPFDIRAWLREDSTGDYFEMRYPMGPDAQEPIVLLTQCPDFGRLQVQYSEVRRLETIRASSGPTTSRTYRAFLLAGRIGALRPLSPCR